MSNARRDILAAVAAATEKDPNAAARVADRLSVHAANVIPQRGAEGEQVVSRFIEEAERAGTDIRQVSALADIPGVVSAYLREQNLAGDVRISSDPISLNIPWADEALIAVSHGAAEPDDTASLSVALCGIAETGTVMMKSSAENPVLLNYLPFLHVGLLPQSRIVGSLEMAWSALRRASGEGVMPRMVNLITGPSRTADIEQELLMGAHGPQKHMVIILKEE